eukprot:m.27929 g.27929  ORF g.27929 m.27929 type:complete len:328 (-) comp11747_c0_seq1:63-1046(-)
MPPPADAAVLEENVVLLHTSENIIDACELSPHVQSAGLFAFASDTTLTVAELNPLSGEMRVLRALHHATKVASMGWSPRSALTKTQTHITLCTAGADHAVRLIESDLERDKVVVLAGHTNFVNSCNFDASGQWLASTGDDCTVRIWNTDTYEQMEVLALLSPGVALLWHPSDLYDEEQSASQTLQFAVAERRGVVRFHHLSTAQPLQSLQVGQDALRDVDWSRVDRNLLGGCTATHTVCWTRSASSLPLVQHPMTNQRGGKFRFCRSDAQLFAVAGSEGVEVCRSNHQQVSAMRCLDGHAAALSWHALMPVLLVAVGCHLRLIRSDM